MVTAHDRSDAVPSERAALVIVVTGVLILPAPTALQVTWLVIALVGLGVSRLRGRSRDAASPPDR